MSRQWRVLISKSHNIYLNLAWEDWLYRNFDFTKASLLLMWRNTPCVVIGRYQNPWKECNVSMMADAGILLARRHSGGGTVYHDMGNLNFSFMTERNLYNRKTNLHFIVKVLQDVYGIRAVVSPRDDIVVNEKLKVSGTAAKLGRKAAYHHCTLLCNVEKEHLRAVLKPNNKGIQTTASESVPSPTVNLAEIAPALTCEALMNSYKKAAYRDLNGSSDEDALEWTEEVLPTEEAYHGVTAEASKLETKDFVFGNTPKFKIARDFEEPTTSKKLSFEVLIEKGVIVGATVCGTVDSAYLIEAATILSTLNGTDFDSAAMWQKLSELKRNVRGSNADFVYHCIFGALSLKE